jgi:hypothetical protein
MACGAELMAAVRCAATERDACDVGQAVASDEGEQVAASQCASQRGKRTQLQDELRVA